MSKEPTRGASFTELIGGYAHNNERELVFHAGGTGHVCVVCTLQWERPVGFPTRLFFDTY